MGNKNSHHENINNHDSWIQSMENKLYLHESKTACQKSLGKCDGCKNSTQFLSNLSTFSVQPCEINSSINRDKWNHCELHSIPSLFRSEKSFQHPPLSSKQESGSVSFSTENNYRNNSTDDDCQSCGHISPPKVPSLSSSWYEIKGVVSDVVQYSKNKLLKGLNEIDGETAKEKQSESERFVIKSNESEKSKHIWTNPWTSSKPSLIPFLHISNSLMKRGTTSKNMSHYQMSVIDTFEDKTFVLAKNDHVCEMRVEDCDISFESLDYIPSKKSASFDDSGVCSMYNSCTSHFLSEGGRSIAEEGYHEIDNMEGMMYPCSYDLIAINKLLRITQERQRSIDNGSFIQEKHYERQSSCGDDCAIHIINANELVASLTTRNFLEVKDLTCFDNFNGNEAEPIAELLCEELKEVLPTFHSSDFSKGKDEIVVIWDSSQILETIQLSLEMNYMELLMQKNEIGNMADKQKAEEKIKRQNLNIFKKESTGNKKLLLLQTLHHLKYCLDQQKTWLQCTYDNILERKWPILHQVKG